MQYSVSSDVCKTRKGNDINLVIVCFSNLESIFLSFSNKVVVEVDFVKKIGRTGRKMGPLYGELTNSL